MSRFAESLGQQSFKHVETLVLPGETSPSFRIQHRLVFTSFYFFTVLSICEFGETE